MTINQRVNEVVKYYKDSQADLARKMDRSPQYINKLIKQETGIGLEFVNLFIEVYPLLNVRWLLTGEGDIISSPENNFGACKSCKEKERLIQQLQDQLKDKERLIQILENKADQKEAC